jgi:hypothetical protein
MPQRVAVAEAYFESMDEMTHDTGLMAQAGSWRKAT